MQHLENPKSPLTATDHNREEVATEHTTVTHIEPNKVGHDLKVAWVKPEEGSGKKIKKLVIPKRHF